MEGVVYNEPVVAVPPAAAVYQFKVAPDEAVAERTTVPEPQRLPGVVPVTVGLLIATTTAELVALMPQAVTDWVA